MISRISGVITVITLLITGRGPPCTIQKAMQVAVISWSQQMNRELSGQFAPLEHCLDAAQIGSRESINHEGSDESNFVQAGTWWHSNDDIWYMSVRKRILIREVSWEKRFGMACYTDERQAPSHEVVCWHTQVYSICTCECVHMSIVCITPVALNNLCPTPQRTSAA